MVVAVTPEAGSVRRWYRKPTVWTAAAVFLISAATHFRVPLLPRMGDALEMSAALLGVVTTLFAVGRLLVDLPAGALLDRVGPRPMFTLSGLLLLVSSALIAVAWGPMAVLAGAVVLGIASAGGNTTGQTFFTRHVEEGHRGRSLATYSAALLGGQAAGPVIAGGAATVGGWRVAMLGAAGLGLVVSAGGWWALRSAATRGGAAELTSATGGTAALGSADEDEEHPADGSPEAAREGLDLGIGQRAALYGARFSGLFLLGAMPQTLIPIIGAENLHLEVGLIGVALGLGGAARIAAAFIGGQLSDRFRRKLILVGGMSLQVVGVVVLLVQGAVWAWVGSIVLVALGSFAMVTGTAILGDHLSDRRAGRELGAYRFVGDLGLLVGPAAGAALFDVAGQRVAVLGIAALVLACTITAGLLLPTGTKPGGR